MAARIWCHGVRRSEHITPVLEDLRWLPVSQRVIFETALMVWKCVHGVVPAYLSDLCVPAIVLSSQLVMQHIQSAATGTLLVPRARTATGERSFAVNGPFTWNRLLLALRSPEDLSDSAFKRALKMHLSRPRRHWDVFVILAPDINIQTYLLTLKALRNKYRRMGLPKNTCRRELYRTTALGFKCSWRKMTAAAKDRAGWRGVVCGAQAYF